jgi:hypothetical protein
VAGSEDAFELVHPRCVQETQLDYEEGIELWKAGDPEEARDALRYALQGCHDNMWIHVALGRLALDEFNDPTLAQGHFGYAVELVRKSMPPGFTGSLPRERRTNRPFFEAITGLIECLQALGKSGEAEQLRAFAARLMRGSSPEGKPAHPPAPGPDGE